MNGFERITHESGVMGGRACIRGMRITVKLVLGLMAGGMSHEEILQEYPALEPGDLRSCLDYAAWLADEEVHPFPLD